MAKDKNLGSNTGLGIQAALGVAANMEAINTQVPLDHPLREAYIKLGIHPTRVNAYYSAVRQSQGNLSKGILPTESPKIEDYTTPLPSAPKNTGGMA